MLSLYRNEPTYPPFASSLKLGDLKRLRPRIRHVIVKRIRLVVQANRNIPSRHRIGALHAIDSHVERRAAAGRIRLVESPGHRFVSAVACARVHVREPRRAGETRIEVRAAVRRCGEGGGGDVKRVARAVRGICERKKAPRNMCPSWSLTCRIRSGAPCSR